MHELAVTQRILEIALEHAHQAGAQRIGAIHLVVGDLSSIVDDSVQFYFDYLTPGTIAEGARLTFQRIPPRCRCRECGTEFAPEPGILWQCPACGAWGGEVLQGREFYIESIEVE
jgi:hydrogenase nickel incorporation protein HypA/HybF